MTLSIIGHGYVGLVSAAVFSDLGNTVWCLGRTREKIENLKKGMMPFFEPGLKEVVQRNVEAGRLKFTLDYQEAIPTSDIVFICVGTPPKNSGETDLSAVFAAAREIGKNLDGYTVVACKSTVPVGTNKNIKNQISCLAGHARRQAGRQAKIKKKKTEFDIASVPEFLREGTALADTLNPERIIIGTESEKAKKLLLELHKPINGKVVLTDIPSAEMIKYAANAFLSTKISFANAIAFLCEKFGADVEKVLDGVGLDSRIGRDFLYPGVGYGGSCFPKDVKGLLVMSQKYGYDFELLRAVNRVNLDAREKFVEKVLKMCGGAVKGKTLGVLGLSFKPNTDDMREAPSIYIITELQKKGAKIRAFDPIAIPNSTKVLKNVFFCKDPYEAADGACGLLIITEWNEFKQLDLGKIKKLLKVPIIVDGRNIYDPIKMKKMGFTYKGVGR